MTGGIGALALACASPAAAEPGPDGCETPTLDEARQRASATFRGVVERVDRDEAGCKALLEQQVRGKVFDDDLSLTRACAPRVTIRVDATWKGSVDATVGVFTALEENCSLRLTAGAAGRVPTRSSNGGDRRRAPRAPCD